MWRGSRSPTDQRFHLDSKPQLIVEDLNARVGDNVRWVAENRIEFHLDDFVSTARETIRVVEYVQHSCPLAVHFVARRIERGYDAAAAHLRSEPINRDVAMALLR